MICFPYYSDEDIDSRIYNIKNTFKYQPRNNTSIMEIIKDSVQIANDLRVAAKHRNKMEAKARMMNAMAASKNRRRR